MKLFHPLSHLPGLLRGFAAALFWIIVGSGAVQAADPGTIPLPDTGLSDQKAGSVLVYVVYTSSASALSEQNTRINITNHSTVSAAFVHLYFVAGATGTVEDTFICLTATQTATFLASDVDPGTTGYLVAIAVDGLDGCPLGFNNLTGDEYVKFASGHLGQLNAVALAAGYSGVMPGCGGSSVTAALVFNGSSSGYDQLPRALVADKVLCPAESNNGLFFLMRLGGNLGIGASAIGALTGFLYDDAGNQYPFSLTTNTRLFQASFSDSFPLTSPNLSVLIPPSRRGWMKIYSTADIGLLGAVISFNPNTATTRTAFSGGQSLHALTLSTSNSIIVPVFPASC